MDVISNGVTVIADEEKLVKLYIHVSTMAILARFYRIHAVQLEERLVLFDETIGLLQTILLGQLVY